MVTLAKRVARSRYKLHTYIGRLIVCLALLAIFTTDTLADSPDLGRKVPFRIASQPLDTALIEFSRQARVPVSVNASSLEEIKAPAIKGTLPAAAALNHLLSGTRLTYAMVGNTVAVSAANAVSASKAPAPIERGSTGAARSDAESIGNSIEEVVITAQKREERLRDVPISISVKTGSDLDRSSAEGVTEALNQVPGVAASAAFQSGGTQVAVRGVTASGPLFNGSSPIAYYLDSVPFGLVKTAIAPDASPFDLQRVEVLRGPQGTLYGASAENGVVRVLTNDANLDRFEAKARALGSFSEEGGGNYRGDAAINLPIINGKLAVRGVVGYQNLSGWIDRPGESDANDAQLRNFRMKVNAQPTDALSVGFSVWSSRNDYGAPPTSADGRTNPSNVDESIQTEYDAYGIRLAQELAKFTVTSETSYLDYTNSSHLDLNALFGLPTLFTGLDAHVFAQELNLNSKSGSGWKWSAGAFYRNGKDRLRQNNLGGGAPYDYTNSSQSYAIYGELGRRFWQDQLEWTLGIRYFNDHVVVRENVNQGPLGSPLIHSPNTFDSTTPRAVLTWYPNQNVTAYASYSEGFRSGFDQDPIVVRGAPELPPAEPDKLHNYELGIKSDLLDRQLTLDTAIYYVEWNGVQQPLLVPAQGTYTSALINGESASGLGVDLGLTGRPVDGLELGLAMSWNNLEMDSPILSSGVVLFEKGDRLNLSPEWTVGALASYAFPLGSLGMTGKFSLAGNYISEQSQRTIFLDAVSIGTGDPTLVTRVAFSLESQARWTATIFIDNLNDEDGAVQRPNLPVVDWATRVRPRTAGLQIDYRLE